jgi:GNAT superfamily N-acetyltransferase
VKEVQIRPAAVDDIGGLVESSTALFADDGATRDRLRNQGWPGMYAAQWCADHVADPAALVLVAVAAHDIVGHLIGTFSEASAMWIAPRAELVSTLVSSSWRGQGVGSRLVEDFVAWARERGASRLQVEAYIANDGALRFYRRHGFMPLSTQLVMDL